MCRFSRAEHPAVKAELQCDDFNWFDAIDEYDGSDLEDEPQGAAENGGLLDVWCQQLGSELGTGSTAQAAAGAPALLGPQVPEQALALHRDVFVSGFQSGHAGGHDLAAVSSTSLRDDPEYEPRGLASAGSSDSLIQHRNSSFAAGKHATSKRTTSKAVYMLDEAAKLERVKQKRRESAQRSRQRKSAYMKELETENLALRAQLDELKRTVTQMQSYIASMNGVPMNGVSGSAMNMAAMDGAAVHSTMGVGCMMRGQCY